MFILNNQFGFFVIFSSCRGRAFFCLQRMEIVRILFTVIASCCDHSRDGHERWTSDVKFVTNMDFGMMKEGWMRDREHQHWGGNLEH